MNNNRSDPNRPDQNKDFWLEFDDSKISKFNMDNFEDECFGSKEEREFAPNLMGRDINISKSAYILVYNKVRSSKLKFHFNEENIGEKEKLINSLIDKESYKFEDNNLITDYYNLNKYLPEKYIKEVKQDNINLILENQILSLNFTNAFSEILFYSGLPNIELDEFDDGFKPTKYQRSLSDILIKIIPDYFFKVYCITPDNFKIKNIVDSLRTALIIRGEKILEFFERKIYKNYNYIIDLLLNSN